MKTASITSAHVLLTKASHIDKPEVSGREGIILYQAQDLGVILDEGTAIILTIIGDNG